MDKLDQEFGKHYLIEMIECDSEKIKFVENVRKIMLRAAKKSKATILKHFFHQFQPTGVSGIVVIAESHLSIHTWPEKNYAAIDIFTCGKMDIKTVLDEFKNGFSAKKSTYNIIPRGF
jgi:S-adenosylmethionine decarboxylase proenzyme